jgi:hypothetical protein
VNIDKNAVLIFDELDRQCANQFLARQVALKGKLDLEYYRLHIRNSNSIIGEKNRYLVELTNGLELGFNNNTNDGIAHVCGVIKEGWTLLADAHSVLAHTCIVMSTVRTCKLQYLFDRLKELTQVMQQQFEEEWADIATFPVASAKVAISELRGRLKSFLIDVSVEILGNSNDVRKDYDKQVGVAMIPQVQTYGSSRDDIVVFGNAFGTTNKVYTFANYDSHAFFG